MLFVFRVRISNSGEVTKSAYHYTNETEALKSFFSLVSSDIGSDAVAENLCMLIDAHGDVIKREHYAKPEEN